MPLFPPPVGDSAIRDPRDAKQEKGKMINPPRYAQLGGLTGPGKIKKNIAAVEKARPGAKG